MGILSVEDGSLDIENLEEEGLSPGKILIHRQGSSAPKLLSTGNVPLDFQKEELLKELAQAKIITEQKKEILQEKMKATSALEKLKERDKEEYDQLVNFEENEFIDDLATTHFKG
jgi:flagellar export protein FliJ